jgi:hypothetical protein
VSLSVCECVTNIYIYMQLCMRSSHLLLLLTLADAASNVPKKERKFFKAKERAVRIRPFLAFFSLFQVEGGRVSCKDEVLLAQLSEMAEEVLRLHGISGATVAPAFTHSSSTAAAPDQSSGSSFGSSTSKSNPFSSSAPPSMQGVQPVASGGASFGKQASGGASFGKQTSGGASFGKHASGGASFGKQASGGASFGKQASGGASFGKQASGGASFGKQASGGASFGKQNVRGAGGAGPFSKRDPVAVRTGASSFGKQNASSDASFGKQASDGGSCGKRNARDSGAARLCPKRDASTAPSGGVLFGKQAARGTPTLTAESHKRSKPTETTKVAGAPSASKQTTEGEGVQPTAKAATASSASVAAAPIYIPKVPSRSMHNSFKYKAAAKVVIKSFGYKLKLPKNSRTCMPLIVGILDVLYQAGGRASLQSVVEFVVDTSGLQEFLDKRMKIPPGTRVCWLSE